MNSSPQRISERVPWFLFGAGIALFWFLGFGYLYMIFSVLPMWGGEVPKYYAFLYPSFSIVPLALALSLFRKHNVVSGILVVAILCTVYGGVQTKKLADYSIARSGKSFSSAVKEHVFQNTRSK